VKAFPFYCYYRCNEAMEMTRAQQLLPDTLGKSSCAFFPGPWWPFRLTPTEQSLGLYEPWVQMEFELETLGLYAGTCQEQQE
jgi:hypothetical protein